jgi:hypothetical protein
MHLERYSDLPLDISTMPADGFDIALASALDNAVAALRDNRFFVMVTGDVIGKSGLALDLWETRIAAHMAESMTLINRCVLVTQVGSKALTAENTFTRTGRLQRTHQYVWVFAKGDPREAIKAARGPSEAEE